MDGCIVMNATSMIARPLGRTGLLVSPIGFGAFKIGRNEGTKYEIGYALPTEDEAARLLQEVLDLGVTLVDTAPAYGVSEERIGAALSARRASYVLSTKVGESFVDGVSTVDFSADAVLASVERSLTRLRTSRLDLVFLHSNGVDEEALARGEATCMLRQLRDAGRIGHLGFSGKTLEGHRRAMAEGFDVLMVEYHPLDRSQRPVLEEAAARGVGVLVKKSLASGRVPPSEAIPFSLTAPAVASCVIGSLRRDHLAACVAIAAASGGHNDVARG